LLTIRSATLQQDLEQSELPRRKVERFTADFRHLPTRSNVSPPNSTSGGVPAEPRRARARTLAFNSSSANGFAR
jgi:hypothetical protein